MTNWPDYNEALRRRGDITIWFTEEAITGWRPAKTGARGRPQEYSDVANKAPRRKQRGINGTLLTAGFQPAFAPRERGIQPEEIQTIAQEGRIAWQQKTGYNLRSHVELAMQRYKRIIGHIMKARALPQQKTEAWISASALNRMTHLGMPVSVKI